MRSGENKTERIEFMTPHPKQDFVVLLVIVAAGASIVFAMGWSACKIVSVILP